MRKTVTTKNRSKIPASILMNKGDEDHRGYIGSNSDSFKDVYY